ncbi:MAG: hypothetical protein KAX39_03475 [candidate division Zixibacteria bacterium]|nr:hypothetical protein [candidate division Zixibacteria bacterium]
MHPSDLRNDIFYDKCKNFVIGAFELLKSYLEKGESIPHDIVQDISIKNDSQWVYRNRFVPLLWHFIYRHAKELEQLQELLNLKKYMAEEPLISKHLNHLVGPTHEKSLVNADRILDPLLYQSFDENKPFQFNADLFDGIYTKVEDFFYSEKIKFIVSAPLQNFQCELEKINLADDLKIVRMTTKEREDLWRSSKYSGWLPDNLLPFFKHSILQNFEKPKFLEKAPKEVSENEAEKNPHEIARAEFNKVVTALRLFRLGIVGFSTVITIPITWLPIGGGSSSRRGEHLQCSKYILTEIEAKEFEVFFKKLFGDKSVSNIPSFINLVLDRFNYAYDRKRPEDKLIDYMIAFETLYLEGDNLGEYGYRIAMRVASLLGKTLDERKQIFSEIKKAYHLRSKIVHGSKKIGDKNSISVQEVSKIEQHLRRSIQEFVKLISNKSHNEIIESLEKALFS